MERAPPSGQRETISPVTFHVQCVVYVTFFNTDRP